ncbi:tripartite motif-containing protein 14-like [Lethenteron reissneri]|uniref:tripartite motif-containing protein 14-like n=1 Tax=Lethenteron reissneri TaxID=7753 RepID=UPI002AB7E2BF|nr:tripartite motif-containing protein 14-like [Lethenteron reissneri]
MSKKATKKKNVPAGSSTDSSDADVITPSGLEAPVPPMDMDGGEPPREEDDPNNEDEPSPPRRAALLYLPGHVRLPLHAELWTLVLPSVPGGRLGDGEQLQLPAVPSDLPCATPGGAQSQEGGKRGEEEHGGITDTDTQGRLPACGDGRSPTLDTNSAGDRLQISSDLRTVTVSAVPQGRPHHPHRFDFCYQALCSESFSSDQHYWDVDVGSAKWYRVGVAYGTIPRKGSDDECLLGGNDVSWCLRNDGDTLSVLHGGVKIPLSVQEPQQRVGVHLDWDAGMLSFYNADSMEVLHSFHQTFTQPLYPGLAMWWGGDSLRIVDLSGAS